MTDVLDVELLYPSAHFLNLRNIEFVWRLVAGQGLRSKYFPNFMLINNALDKFPEWLRKTQGNPERMVTDSRHD